MLSKLPLSKTENIVIQNLESELLIYDLATNKVFCLNEISALVYKACDGKTSFEQFKTKYQFTDDLIFFALYELSKQDLIEKSYESPLKGMKRRDVIKKIGLTSMFALPIISAIIAPTSVMAASTCGGTFAPNTFLGCVPFEQNCLNMFQMCASCATFAVIDVVAPGDPGCDPSIPFACSCL